MSGLKKTATTSAPIHSLISERWSPRAFADRAVEPEKLRSLFEAARWAASSYNGQPWYYIVATKDHPEDYKRVLDCFVEFNQSWATECSGGGVERREIEIRSQRRVESSCVSRRGGGFRDIDDTGGGTGFGGTPNGRNFAREGAGDFRDSGRV